MHIYIYTTYSIAFLTLKIHLKGIMQCPPLSTCSLSVHLCERCPRWSVFLSFTFNQCLVSSCSCIFFVHLLHSLLLFHLLAVNFLIQDFMCGCVCTCVGVLVYKLGSGKIIHLQLWSLFSTCFMKWLLWHSTSISSMQEFLSFLIALQA